MRSNLFTAILRYADTLKECIQLLSTIEHMNNNCIHSNTIRTNYKSPPENHHSPGADTAKVTNLRDSKSNHQSVVAFFVKIPPHPLIYSKKQTFKNSEKYCTHTVQSSNHPMTVIFHKNTFI